jgi:uncharacterized LabA/DUF88 family protein
MNQYAIFVDAGYFFAAGVQALKKQITRKDTSIVNHQDMIESIKKKAQELVGDTKFLRVYWYDAIPGPHMTLDQTTLAHLPGVKLRLGILNGNGQQKGVDSLILTDILELARNHAISDAILIGGDEDLKLGVDLAQAHGVRFHLVGIKFGRKNQSQTLQMAADNYGELDEDFFTAYLQHKIPEEDKPAETSGGRTSVARAAMDFESAAQNVVSELHEEIKAGSPEQIGALVDFLRKKRGIPPEYDSRLIAKIAQRCARRLEGDESRTAREMLRSAILSNQTT